MTTVYKPAEAATVLRVSERTIRRWAADGRIPSIHIGRALRIPARALDELLEGPQKGNPSAA